MTPFPREKLCHLVSQSPAYTVLCVTNTKGSRGDTALRKAASQSIFDYFPYSYGHLSLVSVKLNLTQLFLDGKIKESSISVLRCPSALKLRLKVCLDDSIR